MAEVEGVVGPKNNAVEFNLLDKLARKRNGNCLNFAVSGTWVTDALTREKTTHELVRYLVIVK